MMTTAAHHFYAGQNPVSGLFFTVPCSFNIIFQKHDVVLHVADVGQGTAVLIEMQETERGIPSV